MKYELLAPAGQPDAGYAALEYGADAVYCGAEAFSARAEAVNFTFGELAVFARHAHSLSPVRRVYLALNTLLKDGEVGRAVDTLARALDCGVDAVIVQDLGLARIAREHFPDVELHASTQMAIHSLDGVRAAKRLGFHRVTLARELTLAEIARICAEGGVEIETFVHGTLCYSYSGLCLFSSMTTGRSGNRGRCVYSCREAADLPAACGGGRAHPFSLKDMALGSDVLLLARAGVKSFKIEGRKKSPLYVGATVDYYRRILDGAFAPGGEEECRARLQTIFARPWTKLFLHSAANPDTADTEVVGHRGALLGEILGLAKTPAGAGIRFRAARAVERHDGVQIDIPGEARPFGFAVDNLYVGKGAASGALESVFAARAGAEVVVALPGDAPVLSPGLPVYQSSSQEVKRSYPFARARSGAPEPDAAARVRVVVSKTAGDGCAVGISASAVVPERLSAGAGKTAGKIAVSAGGTFPAFAARDAAGAEGAARKAFSRTGGSRFFLDEGAWEFVNPDCLFVKPGDWNALRREVISKLEAAFAEAIHSANERVHAALVRAAGADAEGAAREEQKNHAPVWSLVLHDAEQAEGFGGGDFCGDWGEVGEIVVPHDVSDAGVARVAELAGRERIRFCLPLIVREDRERAVRDRVAERVAAGWGKWLVPGLGQREWFSAAPGVSGAGGLDLSADWSLYALNRFAVRQLQSTGFSSFAFSPEDDAENLRALLKDFSGTGWLTVYGDVPLFVAAACAHRHLGVCGRGGASGCAAGALSVAMEKSGKAGIFPQACGSVVLPESPFSLIHYMNNGMVQSMGAYRFRVDFRWKRRAAEEIASVWRSVRGGDAPAGEEGRDGNFSRKLA